MEYSHMEYSHNGLILSLVLHIVALLSMSLLAIDVPQYVKQIPIVLTQRDEEIIEPVLLQIYNFSETETNVSEEIAEATKESSLQTQPELMTIDVPQSILQEELYEPSQDFTNIDLLSGVGNAIGNGISSEQSVGGAIDRLTAEIINVASDENVNVLWLLDASISVSSQREEIKNRFEKILYELNLSENTTKDVNHVVVSFGEGLQIINKEPTNDLETLIKSITNIKLDESGIENVYSAVGQLCKTYPSKRDNRTMIIVFTDEVGDDIQNLELVSNLCRRNAVSVYAVAPPAPFGKSVVEFKYVDPDPKFNQEPRWVQIQQGPDGLFPTVLNLQSLPIDNEAIDSGFGSFGLSKLCADTGGIYFSVHPNRSNNKVKRSDIAPLASNISVFFKDENMRMYRPDYSNISYQNKEISTNKVYSALVRACQIPLNIIGDQTMKFSAFTEGEFAEQLSMAQRFAALIEPQINNVWSILQDVEKYSDSIKDKRWDASYHLAMGRISAAKCRAEAYNLTLATAKSGIKKDNDKINTWTLEYSDELTITNSQLEKTFNSAKQHLEYVVSNFPNTPWSYIASIELNTPMGYKWVGSYTEPPKPNMGGGEGGNNIPKDDQKRMLEKKPSRKVDKI